MSKIINVDFSVDMNIVQLVENLYKSASMDTDIELLDEYFGFGKYWNKDAEIEELAEGVSPNTQDFFLDFADKIRKSREDKQKT